jgi:hypothetical protein
MACGGASTRCSCFRFTPTIALPLLSAVAATEPLMQTGVSNVGAVKFDGVSVVPAPCRAIQKNPCQRPDVK